MSVITPVGTGRGGAEDVAAIMAGRTLTGFPQEQVSSLLDFFRRNQYPLLSLRGRVESEEWACAVEADIDECESRRAEYILVRNAWAREGIECIAIKSGGFYPPFPYTSDTLDLLVRREHQPKASFILEQLGYVRPANSDASSKVLFRKLRGGLSVSAIHLHAPAGPDAAFYDDAIWDRARPAEDDPLVMVPSPEDVILINAAHALYEHKRFSLFDLERLRRSWGSSEVDWTVVEGVAARRGWLDGLFFAVAACAQIERVYFGHTTAPEPLEQRWAAQLTRWPVVRAYYRHLLQRSEVALPFAISLAFSKLLYCRKLLGDRDDRMMRRLANVLRALVNGDRA